MTREEAIDTLNAIKALMKIYPKRKKQKESVKQLTEAIDMAIEALTVAVSREDTVTLNSPISIQADMVAVVRCKNCKWQKFIDWGMGDCLHPKGSRHIAYDNHYCSYGERREE